MKKIKVVEVNFLLFHESAGTYIMQKKDGIGGKKKTEASSLCEASPGANGCRFTGCDRCQSCSERWHTFFFSPLDGF